MKNSCIRKQTRYRFLLLGMSLATCCVTPAFAQIAADVQQPNTSGSIFIVVNPESTPLEQFAAKELQRYLAALFGVQAAIDTEAPHAGTMFRIAVLESELGNQTILLRPQDRGLLIAGGSPVATLWAVYELVERWGVRYLIYEDVIPDDQGPLTLPESEIRLEPNMRTRCWRLVNDLADGPVSWSLAENERFLRQIAKMKYNRIFLSFWPTQPFVHYSFRGTEKPAPSFNFGETYPIEDDMVASEKFGDMKVFTNPDFVGADTPEEQVARATQLAKGILAEAKRLSMETGLAIQPFDWPKEFMEVLPGSEPVHQLGNLTAGPGKDQSTDDPLLRDMVATIFRAYVETYPEADYIHVGMPEHRGWTEQAAQAYAMLDRKYGLKELGTFEELCARACARTSFPGGGERVETMLKGDLSSLAFFDSLVEEKDLLQRPDGRPDVRLVYNGVVAELFPLLAKMVPLGGEVLSFIDYTASRQLKQRDLLRQRPPDDLPANLIFTLADDNVGVLPQLATGSLHKILKELRANGWSGFYTRYWTVGDLMPTVHYLAKASWDETVTPESAYRDLFEHVAGPDSVEPALRALALIEQITKGLDDYGLGFGFPVPGMMTKHYSAKGLSDSIKADHQRYRDALAAMRTAREHSDPAGWPFLDYLIGRLVFAVRYLDAAEAFGATARAEEAGSQTEAAQHADEAYAGIREALQAWADVAEDHGDLGAVALMNKYCYWPIRDKRAELRALADAVPYRPEPPDYSKYPAGLWGYVGMDPHEVVQWARRPAVRSRIGHRGLYKAGLTQLANGDILASPCFNDKAANKWRIFIYRSQDEGRTWTKIETQGDELLGKEPAILALPDGGVLVLTSHPHGFRVSRSDDNGVTWSTYPIGPTTEEARFVSGYSAVRDVLVEKDGALTLLMSKGTYYDASAPPSEAWLYRSTDGGRTWAEQVTIPVWQAPEPMFDEVSVVRLPDDRLLAAARTNGNRPISDTPPPRGIPTPGGDESGDHMLLFESEDDGHTWSEPHPLTGYGEPHGHLLHLRDGRILCCYSSYHLPYGVFAMLSEDGGRTWDNEHPIQLALSMNCYTGWPTSIQLANGDILTAYAITGYLEGEGVSLVAPGVGDTAAEAVRWTLPEPKAGRQSERRASAHRKRRIIFNDDGDDVWHPDAATPEGFVSVRLKHMLDTQADTLFYCTTQSFNYFTHNTKVGEVFLNREGPFANNNMQALLDLGTDPLKIAVEFAHANGIEAIWTLRINDIHDAFTPQLWPQWKTDHPDALLGKREDWDANPPGSQARWWAGVDFNREDVRARTVELIEEVARNYDVDGIDLDWLRHPIHFPETLRGEPATQAEIDLLTQLVRDVRATLTRVERERGRPLLLSTRVPLTLRQGKYMGTDIETWLNEGLVDFVTVGGGYMPFSMPTGEVATLCRVYDVPVYPCISASGMTRRAPYGKGSLYGIEAWGATAANAFAQGADGISLFNLFPSPGDEVHNAMVRQAFSELGSPETLAGKDKLFCLDNEAHLETAGYINHVVPYENCLPKSLKPDATTVLLVPVSEVPSPETGSATLRLQLAADVPVVGRMNGRALEWSRSAELEEQFGMVWLTAPVPADVLRISQNQVALTTSGAADETQVTGLELLVRHAR